MKARDRGLAKTIMVQGTGSGVGKSVLVAALCRIFAQDGYHAAPFKAQNMALNSGVTRNGGEMGRAQIMQAQAAKVEPRVEMNPILLKPHADTVAQVIVMGQVQGDMKALDYHQYKPRLLGVIAQCLDMLRAQYDLVVIEGAGSPAEINLRETDIVNMTTAELAHAPVLLVGDIDKGGVFAWLVGTVELLTPEERARVKGFVINKFRGDLALLEPGLDWLEERTHIPVVGVIPFFHHIRVPEEDAVPDWARREGQRPAADEELDIAVVYLPHISNFTDLDALAAEPTVRLRYVRLDEELGQPDVVIIPGSKNTIGDLELLRECGLAQQTVRLAASGTPVVGICGGYQMLGREIVDQAGVESARGRAPGLGLLDVVTEFASEKSLARVRGRLLGRPFFAEEGGLSLSGYEIHMGQCSLGPDATPFCLLTERLGEEVSSYDGAVDPTGLVCGTYLHGLFDGDEFRLAFLNGLRRRRGWPPLSQVFQVPAWREGEYDKLADWVRQSLDMDLLYKIVGIRPGMEGRSNG